MPATPAALAAAVTALHQSGQANTTLRLDPPGLGHLAVHVGLGLAGQVNVLFMPSNTQTAQRLHAGMDGLRHAMSQSGLTLGQAEIGGQGSGGGQQSQSAPDRQAATSDASAAAAQAAAAPETATSAATGLSAYA